MTTKPITVSEAGRIGGSRKHPRKGYGTPEVRAKSMAKLGHVEWTRAEINMLKQLRNDGLAWAEIAHAIGRTKDACVRKWYGVKGCQK